MGPPPLRDLGGGPIESHRIPLCAPGAPKCAPGAHCCGTLDAFHKRVRSTNGCVPQTGAFHKRVRSTNGCVPQTEAERTRLRNAPNAFHKRVRSTNGSGTLPFAERAQCIPQTGAFHKRVRSTNGTFTYGVPPLFWDPKELFWNPRELFYKTKTKRSPSCAGDPPKRYGARCSMHDWGRKGPRNHVSQHAGMVVFYTTGTFT